MNAIDFALGKKWMEVSLYLMVQLICRDKRTVEELIDDHPKELW